MNSWTEGAVAILVVLGVGVGLYLFAGQQISADEPDQPSAPVTVDPEAAARGMTLAEAQGCVQCHTPDGTTASGPTWKGLAGSVRPLTNGEEVVADDAYLFNSVVDPTSQVVEGYESLMPTFYEDQLTVDEIEDLVEYIKSLS